MTYAHEPCGEDVEEEPADALLRSQRHDSGPIAVAPLAPPEHHLPVPQGHESVIAERHAMGIATQVGHDMLRRGKGRLGIDDPGLLPQWREEMLEGLAVHEGCCGPRTLEVALRIGTLEGGEIRAAKHPGERPHGKEKVAALGRNPAVALWRSGAAGDHTVDMDMVFQGLTPGMQDHGDPACPAEPRRVTPEGL